jgi:ABC-type polysaccharide/polyol phosphate transport system ATPase subunit
MNAIELHNVTKIYQRYNRRRQFATLKSALLSGSLIRDLRPDDTFAAVRDVSFTVPRGRTLGVIGRNGSGKSTLLKLVAGITKPSTGHLTVNGRISALIELGAGFHPEISGRENVYINGMMLGMSRREIARRFDDIVAFAELEPFIDAPVKTYSSGMYMRLGFAVAVTVDPDVLLVDEVLAVGDEAFTHKCLDKFAEFKRRGKTIVLVTHALDLVQRFCDEALWLNEGVARTQGDPKRVIDAYLLDVAAAENRQLTDRGATDPSHAGTAAAADRFEASEGRAEAPPDMFAAVEGRWGSREAEITRVTIVGPDRQPTHVLQSGERMEIAMEVRAAQPISDFAFGIGVFNADGVCCCGTNTQIEGAAPGELFGESQVRFIIDSLDLVEGTYKLDVAVHRAGGAPYDYHRQLYTFRVTSRTKEVGIYRPRHSWQFSGGVRIGGLE